MSKVVVMDHPLIQHKIGIIRREETGSKDFRTLVSEIAMVVGNICNVDTQLKASLRGLGQADGIIDVLSLGTVNGEDGQGTHPFA